MIWNFIYLFIKGLWLERKTDEILKLKFFRSYEFGKSGKNMKNLNGLKCTYHEEFQKSLNFNQDFYSHFTLKYSKYIGFVVAEDGR